MELFDIIGVAAVVLLALVFMVRTWRKSLSSSQSDGAGCPGCSGGCSSSPAPGSPLGDLRNKE